MHLTTKQKLQIATLLSRTIRFGRHLLGYGDTAQVTRRGVRWALDLCEGIDLALYLGVYETGTSAAIRRRVRDGWVVLDVGANIGAHTLPMADRVGASGRVVAFEPTDYAFAKLRQNISLNPGLQDRIFCCQTLLVEEMPEHQTANAPIHSSWPLADAKNVHPFHRGRLMTTNGATAITLDQSVSRLGLQRVDFVKLDVDGHEMSVLQGARETLRRFRPTLVMEFAPYVYGEEGFRALLTLLRDFGYQAEGKLDQRPVPLTVDGILACCSKHGGVDLILRPMD